MLLLILGYYHLFLLKLCMRKRRRLPPIDAPVSLSLRYPAPLRDGDVATSLSFPPRSERLVSGLSPLTLGWPGARRQARGRQEEQSADSRAVGGCGASARSAYRACFSSSVRRRESAPARDHGCGTLRGTRGLSGTSLRRKRPPALGATGLRA